MTVTTDQLGLATSRPPLHPDLQDLQLRDVIRSLPKAYFEKNAAKAWFQAGVSVVAAGLGYAAIAVSPWYLLPFAWFFTGTALTGWFVIGHDCGHRSFSNRRWVNNLVGHFFMLPLIYPFHGWRLLHDHHHLHTNKVDEDNAWHPWSVDSYVKAPGWLRVTYRYLRGWLWWLASIAHWAGLHFDPNGENIADRDRDKVRFSATVVILFAAIVFPTLIITTGVWGFIKFWVVPWLVYHFWMSTFTLVHHTDPNVQFYPAATWNEVEAQLAGTIHCTYPRWIEFLCHDINVHVPHHISTGIPSYNLRPAHAFLKERWGNVIQERTFSLGLMKQIVEQCHIYDPVQAYRPFREIGR